MSAKKENKNEKAHLLPGYLQGGEHVGVARTLRLQLGHASVRLGGRREAQVAPWAGVRGVAREGGWGHRRRAVRRGALTWSRRADVTSIIFITPSSSP